MFNCCFNSIFGLNNQPSLKDIDNAKTFVPPIETTGFVVKVYDGDTITIVTKLQFKESPYYKFSVRLNGIDTPEMRGPNKDMAIIAKDALSELVFHKNIVMENVKTEKYGRLLADVYVDGLHVNAWLIEKGYAKSYFGGKKEEIIMSQNPTQ